MFSDILLIPGSQNVEKRWRSAFESNEHKNTAGRIYTLATVKGLS